MLGNLFKITEVVRGGPGIHSGSLALRAGEGGRVQPLSGRGLATWLLYLSQVFEDPPLPAPAWVNIMPSK